jgi:hypothetical protein
LLSKADWELQTAVLKLYGSFKWLFQSLWGVYTDCQTVLEKLFVSHLALEQMLHTTSRGFRKICANSEHFARRKLKFFNLKYKINRAK